jgi:hypothetical protein
MGLGIYARSQTPNLKSIFGFGLPRLLRLSDIENSTRRFAGQRGIADLMSASADQDKLEMTLHPSGEPCSFQIEKEFTTFSAKTSTVGPGYHALIVELLSTLSAELGLKWEFDGKELVDETGYWTSRNFLSLQKEMSNWLQTVANVLERPDAQDASFNINLPLGYGDIDLDAAVFTPIGPFDKLFFSNAIRDEERLEKASKQFFPWWNKEIDARFWRAAGLTIMWIEVPWHPPVNDIELKAVTLALSCMDKAKKLDDQVGLPEGEIAELKSFVDAKPEKASPPQQQGIGYRRYVMSRQLPGGWTIKVPGYFFDQDEDEGRTTVYWFGDYEVRGSSITIEPAKGKTPDFAGALSSFGNEPGEEVITWSDYGYSAKAGFLIKENNGSMYELVGGVMRSNSLCIVTIVFRKLEDKPRALDSFKSVRLPEVTDE